MAVHYHDSAFGYVVEVLILLKVVTNLGIFGNADIFVEDGAADLGAAADIAVVKHDGIFDHRAGVNANASAQHRVSYYPPERIEPPATMESMA